MANESSGVGRKLSKRYALMREDVGHDFGEFARIVAHVVPYDHRNLGQVGECLFEVVGEALGGSTYSVDVHAVGAGTHDASQTACAELKVLVERFDELCGVVGVKHLLHLGTGSFIVLVGKPKHGFFFYGFEKFLVVFHILYRGVKLFSGSGMMPRGANGRSIRAGRAAGFTQRY